MRCGIGAFFCTPGKNRRFGGAQRTEQQCFDVFLLTGNPLKPLPPLAEPLAYPGFRGWQC